MLIKRDFSIAKHNWMSDMFCLLMSTVDILIPKVNNCG